MSGGSPNLPWIRESTLESLQLLAAPADRQLDHFPEFACVPDELALDFDHWREVYLAHFARDVSPYQIECFDQIAARFHALSSGGPEFREDFWTADALQDSPEWERIRRIARRLLAALGWPLEHHRDKPDNIREALSHLRELIQAGAPHHALTVLDQFMNDFRQHGDHRAVRSLAYFGAATAETYGQPQRAIAYLEGITDLDYPGWHAGLSRLYQLTGDTQRAAEHLSNALNVARQIGDQHWIETLEFSQSQGSKIFPTP